MSLKLSKYGKQMRLRAKKRKISKKRLEICNKRDNLQNCAFFVKSDMVIFALAGICVDFIQHIITKLK